MWPIVNAPEDRATDVGNTQKFGKDRAFRRYPRGHTDGHEVCRVSPVYILTINRAVKSGKRYYYFMQINFLNVIINY